jgi:predicted phage baseplate assembly protein
MLAPTVDPRSFQDLVDEAKRRIPQYCPEWTDHNVSDPGVMLVELFAWMVHLLTYRLNQVPDRDLRQLLELIGARPDPPVPAQAELLFWLTAPVAGRRVVPRGVAVATRQTETEPAVVFTTDADLPLVEPRLRHLVLARQDGGADVYEDVSDRLDRLARRHEPLDTRVFQGRPEPGDAFLLGFAESVAGHALRLSLDVEDLGATGINQDDPPLVWEFWRRDGWKPLAPGPEAVGLLHRFDVDLARLGHRLDDTRGLARDGQVVLIVPTTCELATLPLPAGPVTACWLRCRAVRDETDDRFYERSPIIHRITAESIGGLVGASHAVEIVEEDLGYSDGTPGQRFALLNPPILPRRSDGERPETIEVTGEDGAFEPWQEVESFGASGPTDSHFTLDSLSGEVRFGPRLRAPGGEERQLGRVPPRGSRIRFASYRTGGRSAVHVGAGALVVPKSASDISYVKWVANLRPATRGRDGETLEELKLRAPDIVRSREVAVTRQDFEYHATRASPRVARARCADGWPNGPGADGASGPGHVRLMVVPVVSTLDGLVTAQELELPDALQREVKAYLQERCPLTVELEVRPACYRRASVAATLVTRQGPGGDEATRERRRAQIRAEAERRLYRLIHPTTGGADGRGWPWGKPLTLVDVHPLLQGVPGVAYVADVRVTSVDDGSDPSERELALAEDELLCSGQHEITVVEG